MKPVRRLDRHDLVCTLKADLLVEALRRRNRAEQALWGSVEVVGGDVLGAILKVGNGSILDDRQFRRLERPQCRERDDDHHRDRIFPRSPHAILHLFLVHRANQSCQGCGKPLVMSLHWETSPHSSADHSRQVRCGCFLSSDKIRAPNSCEQEG